MFVLIERFRIFKISIGIRVHPFFIDCEGHSKFAFEGRNLIVEAILITIKDSDIDFAKVKVGGLCINNMSIWCLVSSGPFS
jgi:hypothetical protein